MLRCACNDEEFYSQAQDPLNCLHGLRLVDSRSASRKCLIVDVPFLLSEAQMRRIEPYFPLFHGIPRVDDRRIISGIVYVIKHGLMWRDAPKGMGRKMDRGGAGPFAGHGRCPPGLAIPAAFGMACKARPGDDCCRVTVHAAVKFSLRSMFQMS